MSKLFSITVPLSAFLTKDLTEEETAEETSKIKEFFSIEEDKKVEEVNVDIATKLESFLWYLFTKVKPPMSPLRYKAHEAHLAEIAHNLNLTLDKEEMPKLEVKDLDLIAEFVSDEEAFETLVDVPFEVKVSGAENPPKLVPLPAMNIMRMPSFVDTLAKVFDVAGEQANV